MRKTAFSLLILVAALAVAQTQTQTPTVSIATLLEKPSDFDRKAIKVKGKVDKFEQRVSKIGKPYFVFKLHDEKPYISVYGRGSLDSPLKDGVVVEVEGTFRSENEVGKLTYKNEIEVTPKNVRIVKNAKEKTDGQAGSAPLR